MEELLGPKSPATVQSRHSLRELLCVGIQVASSLFLTFFILISVADLTAIVRRLLSNTISYLCYFGLVGLDETKVFLG